MKNVKENQIKNCIYETLEDFTEIYKNIFGKSEEDCEDFDVDFDSEEGIYFCGIDNEEVYKEMAKYYGVSEVVTIHTDHWENTGVWIVYKE